MNIFLKKYYKIILIALILLIGAFLRLYRISDFTEFLGDQGSAGVVIYEAWKNKTIPLHGPAVSSGQYPGPFYYYLIAPWFIISGFNPVWPAIFFAILGVLGIYLLYRILEDLYGFRPAIFVSLIYAISPKIVETSRVMWNPTAIPFLVLLLVFSFIKICKGKHKFFILAGLVNGLLVQLHYTNIYTLGVSILFWLGIFINYYINHYTNIKTEFEYKKWLFSGLYLLIAFFVSLLPFIIFEVQNGFTDIKSLIESMVFNPGGIVGKRVMLMQAYDYTTRTFSFLAPSIPKFITVIVMVFVFIFQIVNYSKFNYFLLFWYFGGIIMTSRYKMPIHDHYLLFISVLPLFSTANLLKVINTLKYRTIYFMFLIIGSVVILLSNDVKASGLNDIPRTKKVTEYMIKHSGGKPFSFTLTSSRSFSDYHYRFYFLINGVQPNAILDSNYNQLFLVCETDNCPISFEMKDTKKVKAMCYDHHCQGEYPVIDMDDWSLNEVDKIKGATIYSYDR
ncbi:glycosyltransferase family 39 protein [Patescibacteria group bacterium]